MEHHLAVLIEANLRHTNRVDGLALAQLGRGKLHAPTEIVVAPRPGDIVEGDRDARHRLGGFFEVVLDGVGTLNGLQGVIEEGVGGVDVLGVRRDVLWSEIGEVVFDALDGRLFLCAALGKGSCPGRSEGLLINTYPGRRRVWRLAGDEQDGGEEEQAEAEPAGDGKALEERVHCVDTIEGGWGIRSGNAQNGTSNIERRTSGVGFPGRERFFENFGPMQRAVRALGEKPPSVP